MGARNNEMSAYIGAMVGAVLFLMVGYFSEQAWSINSIMDKLDTADPFTTLIAAGILTGWVAVATICVFLGVFSVQGITNLLNYGKLIDAELAANNGQLRPLPPAPMEDMSSDLSHQQDPKS